MSVNLQCSVQTIHDGAKNLIVNVILNGNGLGDLKDFTIANLSLYPPNNRFKLVSFESVLSGLSARLSWNGGGPSRFLSLPEGESGRDLSEDYGGLFSAASAPDGTLRITTLGLEDIDSGSILLKLEKSYSNAYAISGK